MANQTNENDLWQPIASAPRDGTVILLARDGEAAVAGFFDPNDGGYPWAFLDTGVKVNGLNGYRDDGGDFGPEVWRPMPTYDKAALEQNHE